MQITHDEKELWELLTRCYGGYVVGALPQLDKISYFFRNCSFGLLVAISRNGVENPRLNILSSNDWSLLETCGLVPVGKYRHLQLLFM